MTGVQTCALPISGFFIDELKITDGANILFYNSADDSNTMSLSGDGSDAAEWIELKAGVGELLPGALMRIPVKINTADMKPGNYYGKISIVSNDTSQSELKVPLHLQVEARERDLDAEIQEKDSVWLLCSRQSVTGWIENVGRSAVSQISAECLIFQNSNLVSVDTAVVEELPAGEGRYVEFKVSAPADSGQAVCVLRSKLNSDENITNNTDTTLIAVTDVVDDFSNANSKWSVLGDWRCEVEWKNDHFVHVMKISGESVSQTDIPVLTFKQPLNTAGLNSLFLHCNASWWQSADTPVCYIEVSPDSLNWSKMDSLSGSVANYTHRSINLLSVLQSKNLWFRFRYNAQLQDNSAGVSLNRITLSAESQVHVAESVKSGPENLVLHPNVPNPFNPVTTVSFTLSTPGYIKLDVFNLQGQHVDQLVSDEYNAGTFQVKWNAERFPSGLYFYRLQANTIDGSRIKVGKMNLVR